MGMKPGYKQTELGVIPEDWEEKPAHEIGVVRTGPFGTLLKAAEYSAGDGVPLISVGEIREGFLRITDHTPRVSDAVTQRLPQYVLRKGDIVFGRKGGVERSALIRQPQEGWFLGSDGISLRPSRDCHHEYLALQFRSARVQGWLLQNAIGTTMPSLNQGILRNVTILLPPTKAEQEAIAQALSDADALIDSLEQLLDKKRRIKQGAMHELLTGKRLLPDFSEEWEIRRLEQLAEIRSGGTPSTTQSNFWNGDILWCTPTDVSALNGSKYLSRTDRTISQLGLQSSSAEVIPAQSVVMTSRATIGECAITQAPTATNQGFKNFVPFGNTDVEFLYYLLCTQKQRLISLCGGSTFLEIGKTQLAAFEVRVPRTKREQAAIASVLFDMDAEIVALEAKFAKAREIKQGMMQELLTGTIRLI
jgi:type I restriction enzyme S subunit